MQDRKLTILNNALKLVPFDGWTDYTLKQAALQAGVGAPELKKLFPAGVNDCVALFHNSENEVLAQSLPPETLAKLRVPERIEKIIMTRLVAWRTKREIIRRTIGFNALPWNNLSGCKSLYDTVDMMWRLAGDKSTDFNYYTKRMTLSAVYSSTVLYWLNDASENYEETERFLKSRLENVASFGRFKKKLFG